MCIPTFNVIKTTQVILKEDVRSNVCFSERNSVNDQV